MIYAAPLPLITGPIFLIALATVGGERSLDRWAAAVVVLAAVLLLLRRPHDSPITEVNSAVPRLITC